LIRDGDEDGGGGDSGDDVYKGSVKPILVSPSNSYSKDEKISVGNSRHSSCPAYTILLTTALKKTT